MKQMKFESYSEKQFRNKITYFSFWLSFFVIGIHTYNVQIYGLSEKTDLLSKFVLKWEQLIRSLSNVCVPFFFLISGYLFFRTFEWSKLFDKYKSRFRTIVVPYIIWCSVYYLYYCILSRIAGISDFINSGSSIDFTVRTWGDWLWNQSYYTLWFLKELIVMIICTPIIYLVLRNYKHIPVGSIVVCFALLKAGGILNPEKLELGASVFYLLGAFIGINYKNAPLKKNSKLTMIARITFVGIVIWQLLTISNVEVANIFMCLLLCVSLWWSFDGFSYQEKLKWWYGISFFVYCIHDIFLEGFEKIFLLLFGTNSIFAILDYAFMPIFVMIICVFTAAILRKYFSTLWRILIGGRGE